MASLRQHLEVQEAESARLQNQADLPSSAAEHRDAQQLLDIEALHHEAEQQLRQEFAAQFSEMRSGHEQQVVL